MPFFQGNAAENAWDGNRKNVIKLNCSLLAYRAAQRVGWQIRARRGLHTLSSVACAVSGKVRIKFDDNTNWQNSRTWPTFMLFLSVFLSIIAHGLRDTISLWGEACIFRHLHKGICMDGVLLYYSLWCRFPLLMVDVLPLYFWLSKVFVHFKLLHWALNIIFYFSIWTNHG